MGPVLDPKVYLIEGIGSKSSFLNPLGNCGNFGVSSVLCFSIDSVIVLVNNNITMQPPCGLLTSLESERMTMAEQFQLVPNPTTGLVFVESESVPERIQFHNLRGQLLKEVYKPSSQIDISELDLGVYILSVHFKSGEISKQKLVKQ